MLIIGKNFKKFDGLKSASRKSFSMKDLGPIKKILSIKINQDGSNKLLWLSQEKYLEQVLESFSMHKVKLVNTLLGGHFKLSTKQNSITKKEQEAMRNVSYQSIVKVLCIGYLYST